MKKLLITVLAIAATFTLILPPVQAVEVQETMEIVPTSCLWAGTINTSGVNVRRGAPGTAAHNDIVGHARHGGYVAVMQTSGGFARVSAVTLTNGTSFSNGWISTQFITASSQTC